MKLSTTPNLTRQSRAAGVSQQALRGVLDSLERPWDETYKQASIVRTIVINGDGVFLGATKLAPQIYGWEQKIYALVSFVAGSLAPSSLTKTLEAAAADYKAGDKPKSAMRLALAIPTPLMDEATCRRLHVANGLIDNGFLSPHDLLTLMNIGGSQHAELAKYSSDQPRAPAGQSDGGQWISEDSGSVTERSHKTPLPRQERVGVAMPDGCEGEWASAIGICEKLLARPNPPRSLTGGHTTVLGCARGFVSMRCGGNIV